MQNKSISMYKLWGGICIASKLYISVPWKAGPETLVFVKQNSLENAEIFSRIFNSIFDEILINK